MDTHQALSKAHISHAIDYWVIGPKVTETATLAACSLARQHGFACITIKPCYLQSSMTCMHGSKTAVGTVAGYPFGADSNQVKIAGVKRALAEGAQELALYINLGYLIEGQMDACMDDIHQMIGLAHMNGARTKTILDLQNLSDEQVKRGAEALKRSHTDLICLYLQKSWSNSIMKYIAMLQDIIKEAKTLGIVGNFKKEEDLEKLVSAGVARIGITGLPDFLDATSPPR